MYEPLHTEAYLETARAAFAIAARRDCRRLIRHRIWFCAIWRIFYATEVSVDSAPADAQTVRPAIRGRRSQRVRSG